MELDNEQDVTIASKKKKKKGPPPPPLPFMPPKIFRVALFLIEDRD